MAINALSNKGFSGRRSIENGFTSRGGCALMSGNDAMDIEPAKNAENEDENENVYLRIKLYAIILPLLIV